MATELTPNEGKKGVTVINGVSYQRLPIKTHLITKDDDIVEVAYQYGAPVMADKDDVFDVHTHTFHLVLVWRTFVEICEYSDFLVLLK